MRCYFSRASLNSVPLFVSRSSPCKPGSEKIQEVLGRNDVKVLVKAVGFHVPDAASGSAPDLSAGHDAMFTKCRSGYGGEKRKEKEGNRNAGCFADGFACLPACLPACLSVSFPSPRIALELLTERDKALEKMHRERSQSNRRYGGGAAATDENFCSHCKRKIESGRRRLFTGPTQGKSRRPSLAQHDTMANIIMYSVCTSAVCTGDWQAPPGEYRYCCGVCEGFQLCTDCFDRHEQGNDQRMHFKVCTNAWQT